MFPMMALQLGRVMAGTLQTVVRRTLPIAALLLGVVFMVGGLACGTNTGGPTRTQSPAPATAPTITSFVAPGYTLSGQMGLLSWSASGATSFSLDQGIGTVTGTSYWIFPTTTTTYTLTASNPGGTTTATCTATVYPATAGPTSMLASFYTQPLVDGPAASARFNYSAGVALDSVGNLYVADYGNHALRMLSPQGMVTTVLSGMSVGPWAVAAGPSGNLYVSVGSSICKFTPGSGLTTLAGSATQPGSVDGTGSSALFNIPRGLAVDAAENIYVADWLNSTIRLITPTGVVTTLAGAAGVAGHVDGTGPSALFNQPLAIAVGPSGNLFVLDSGDGAIRSITPQGVVSTLVGGLPLWSVNALAAGSDGSLFVGGSNSIVKVTAGGTVTTLAGKEGQYGFVNGAGSSAKFTNIEGLALGAGGNIYAADYQNSVIRLITPAAAVTTLAGREVSPSFGPVNLGVDGVGNVFVPSNNNTILKITAAGSVTTFAGVPNQSGNLDGSAARALFGAAGATAVDAAGNVYVTDLLNATLRKITAGGEVTTVAGVAGQPGHQDGLGAQARFNGPVGIAVDGPGTVYITDGGSTIRKMTPDGNVTTLAGAPGQYGFTDGTGSSARFNHPDGIAVDPSGNVFVADRFNAAIRKITPAGVVTTLSFTLGSVGSVGAVAAGPILDSPMGIAVDGNGNVYVENFLGHGLWQISADGIASQVPRFNAPETLNFSGTGIAVRGGTIYVASPWGVELVSRY